MKRLINKSKRALKDLRYDQSKSKSGFEDGLCTKISKSVWASA